MITFNKLFYEVFIWRKCSFTFMNMCCYRKKFCFKYLTSQQNKIQGSWLYNVNLHDISIKYKPGCCCLDPWPSQRCQGPIRFSGLSISYVYMVPKLLASREERLLSHVTGYCCALILPFKSLLLLVSPHICASLNGIRIYLDLGCGN